jgi:CRP-like cAMP-binding protein
MENLEAIIAGHPFVKDLAPELLRLLYPGAKEVVFAAGEIIAAEGAAADRFFLLLSGEVAIEATIAEEGQVALQRLRAGDALGWSWLFPPFRWHFTARAVETTRAVAWDTAQLRAEADANPRFGYALASRLTQVLLQRLGAARQQMVEFYGAQG